MGPRDRHPVSKLLAVWSRLSFVVLDPRLEKQPRLWEQAARKPRGRFEGGFWVNYSHATHVAASPREAEGSFPCRSGYPEQPRANHYHLDAPSTFSAAPGPDGFHMAPRHLRHHLCKAPSTHRYTHSLISFPHNMHVHSAWKLALYNTCICTYM